MLKTQEIYKDLFKQYGAKDERSLGWSKNKQNYRFERCLRFLKPKCGESLLDIGCGFGDLYRYLQSNGGGQNTSALIRLMISLKNVSVVSLK